MAWYSDYELTLDSDQIPTPRHAQCTWEPQGWFDAPQAGLSLPRLLAVALLGLGLVLLGWTLVAA